jgi:hypothetical protein
LVPGTNEYFWQHLSKRLEDLALICCILGDKIRVDLRCFQAEMLVMTTSDDEARSGGEDIRNGCSQSHQGD